MSGRGSEEHSGFRVVVLSGPSGSGKSTIVNRLMHDSPVRLFKAISATTRPPRVGEIHGKDYYFLSQQEFDVKRDRGELLECAEVYGSGYWYGTLRSEIDRARTQGAWAFLEIDVQGALRVMEEFPDAVTIFLKTPTDSVYEQRLRDRGTESEEVIRRRLATANKELESANRYGYQIINDDLDRAVAEIVKILSTVETKSHAG
ncbi:MAG: guanylate kinase [Planctomycetaceae bacterium]